MTNMENLYNYVFWYNPYENLWYAIERNSLLLFFNGKRKESVHYKSKEHSTLVEILMKEGLAEELKQS